MKRKIKKVIARYKYLLRSNLKSIKNSFPFNYWLLFSFLLALFLVVLFFYEHDKLISLPSISSIIYIVESLFRVTTLFIGIIIALVILSFQIFSNNFGQYAFIGFFKNRYFKLIITLYTINILYGIYCLSYFKEAHELNIYGTILFVSNVTINTSLILLLFPLAIQMIKNSQGTQNLKDIVYLINEEWIYKYFFHKTNNLESVDLVEKNPLLILKGILIKAIKSDDQTTVELVLTDLSNHLKKMSEDHEFKNNTINEFYYFEISKLLTELFQQSLNNTDILLPSRLIYKRLLLEEWFIKKKVNRLMAQTNDKWKYDGLYFKMDIESCFDSATMTSNEELDKIVIKVYYDYCVILVNDYFPARFKEYDRSKYKEYSDEKFMCHNLFSSDFDKLVNTAHYRNRLKTFDKIFNYYSLHRVIIDSMNSKSVKVFMIHLLNYSLEKSFKSYLELDVKSIPWLNFPFITTAQDEISSLDRKTVFNLMKKALDMALAANLLNSTLINGLKSIGLFFLKNIKEKSIHQKLLIEVIEKFDDLRNKVSSKSDNYSMEIYILLSRYFGYVEYNYSEAGITDKQISTKFSELTKKFTKSGEYEIALESEGYIIRDHMP